MQALSIYIIIRLDEGETEYNNFDVLLLKAITVSLSWNNPLRSGLMIYCRQSLSSSAAAISLRMSLCYTATILKTAGTIGFLKSQGEGWNSMASPF